MNVFTTLPRDRQPEADWDAGVIARIGINERSIEAPRPIVEVLVLAPEVRISDEVVGCENE